MVMKDVKDVYGDSGSTNLNTIIPCGVESEKSQDLNAFFGTAQLICFWEYLLEGCTARYTCDYYFHYNMDLLFYHSNFAKI